MTAISQGIPQTADQSLLAGNEGIDSSEFAKSIIVGSLEDSKAHDIQAIDIAQKSSLGDFLIVASGGSDRHVKAIAEHLITALKEANIAPPRVEGLTHCDWVLIDAGDVIVHIFRPEVREFYNLEKMWLSPMSDPNLNA